LISRIANQLNLPINSVNATVQLLSDGATIPFIARYRKEATNGLDEIAIQKIEQSIKQYKELEKRKETIFQRLKELEINDENLIQKITNCYDNTALEDLYLPYKPKRKTKASAARDLGLEPLAKIIMAQNANNLNEIAKRYTKPDIDIEAALQGARNIIAEWISEHTYTRKSLRQMYEKTALLVAKVNKKNETEAIKYKDYFDFSQSIKRIPSHRLLAIFRAENDNLLKVKIDIDKENALQKINGNFVKSNGAAAQQIMLAAKDSFKRLLAPSLETELRNTAKLKADEEAIDTFANNLKQLLLAAPLGQKNIMALDPGFRTGCKLVCIDKQGSLLTHTTIYPHPPIKKIGEATDIVLKLIQKFSIHAIAIGNGTAGRETQQFIKSILTKEELIEVYLISEAGASIYSASEIARNEFPDLDLTVRGSISIARRLMDPLAELVKIDPKSIGIGQYQHDVAQDKLKDSLDTTVSIAVNQVGVNVNTASTHLLKYVAGIGPALAENIVNYRKQNKGFTNRKELLKVKGLGVKAFEQAAGFLRIKEGNNPLDASAVHPERYGLVEKMAKRNNAKIENLIANPSLTKQIKLTDFVDEDIGLPTLKDIIEELDKPGLDPRGAAKAIVFDENLKTIKDLKRNMALVGKVTNLTKFGAFVDIGIKENGLIHKSQIADTFIDDPADVLNINQEVKVKVLEIDLERKRIQLTMKF